MIARTEQAVYEPEDLLTMPDGKRFELAEGALVGRKTDVLSSLVIAKLVSRLGAFCAAHKLGYVIPCVSGGFQGFPGSPKTVRKPDVAFVRFGRFPNEQVPTGFARLVPDLAIEVVSSGDLYDEVDVKVEEYLRAKVALVWVISPVTRVARIHRADGSCASVREGGELDGEGVLPGFRCPLADIFQGLPAVAAAEGTS
jgi:Uma2 family endonuclease